MKTSTESVESDLQIKRPYCPFYGFSNMGGSLIDSKGNQCALITNSYSPCQMEMREEEPNWQSCPLNNTEIRQRLTTISDKAKVFPEELSPNGVQLKDWMKNRTGPPLLE